MSYKLAISEDSDGLLLQYDEVQRSLLASPEMQVADAETQDIVRRMAASSRLTPRERSVINRLWLEPYPATRRRLATEMAVTPSRVRQIEVRALRKLRRAAPMRALMEECRCGR
jgi:RNA polymerase sigma factor (sigma-70 family)